MRCINSQLDRVRETLVRRVRYLKAVRRLVTDSTLCSTAMPWLPGSGTRTVPLQYERTEEYSRRPYHRYLDRMPKSATLRGMRLFVMIRVQGLPAGKMQQSQRGKVTLSVEELYGAPGLARSS